MNNEIIELIRLYRKYVDEMIVLLKNEASNFNGYKQESTRKGNFLSRKEIFFSFHGMGCRFDIGDIVVDIDYAKERYDRIDMWFLKLFWESVINDYSFNDFNEIKAGINILLKKQVLIKDQIDQDVFYLAEEWSYPKVFEW